MDTWAAAHEELKELAWDLFIGNISTSFSNAPRIGPEVWHQITLFRDAVNWQDPFFSYLSLFHLTLFSIAFLVATILRGNPVRLALFSLTLIILADATFLCLSWLHDHAHYFFSERVNYFDEAGLFLAVVFWFPIVCCAMVLQVVVVVQMWRQRRELQRRGMRSGSEKISQVVKQE